MGVWTGGVKKENCERKLGGGEGDTGAVFFFKSKTLLMNKWLFQ